jgi:hypothetical protein
MGKGQQYSAHRVVVFSAPFAIALAFGWIPRTRVWIAIGAAAFVLNLYPAARMVNYLRTNYIRVTAEEREIGDRWIPQLPPESRVMIDIEEDLQLFYSHYMYAEVLRGVGGDERRIVFPRTFYSFVKGTLVEDFDPQRVDYVIRRKGVGRLRGTFQTIATNRVYELLVPVDRAAMALVWYGPGFTPLEYVGPASWRWLVWQAQLIIASGRDQHVRILSGLNVNPAIQRTDLEVATMDNSQRHFMAPVPPSATLDIRLPVRKGSNAFAVRSYTLPKPLGAHDPRELSVQFINPRADIVTAP